MAKTYTNLHQHTVYSMLDGYATVEGVAERAAGLGMTALAQTDHGNIHGWMKFKDACEANNIKPLLGMEGYQARKTRHDRDAEEFAGRTEFEWEQRGPYHLTLIAKNFTGYQNLMRISSLAFTEGYYAKPRLDYELLETYGEGLIILSGCLSGEVQQALLRGDYAHAILAASSMRDIVGKENYFIEIMDHGIDLEKRVQPDLIKIAKELGVPIVPTGDCHYTSKEDHDAHDAMLCVATGSRINDENRFRFIGPEFYLKSYDEMATLFEPEWLDNTNHIADMVDVRLDQDQLHFPDFQLPEDEPDLNDYFHKQVWAGLETRYGLPLPEDVKERANHELGVVARMGFEPYFLVVADILHFMSEEGIITGPGRGSAASSIISYALRITHLDPLAYGLIFERFLVEGRKEMPDIDIDIDDRYRDRVIKYVQDKYGEDHVAHIVTFSTIKAKQSIQDAARILDYDYTVGNKISNMIPPAVLGVSKTIDQSLETADFRKAYEEDPDAKKIIDTARYLEGSFRQTGIHAAGVIISKGPVQDYVPVFKKKNKNGTETPLTSQWDMYDAERSGLLKIDFLGLRNLGVIDMCLHNIKDHRDIDMDMYDIPLDDTKTYETLQKGDTKGVFQIESPGMTEMTQAISPHNLEDLMAVLALFRPGPMGSGMDKNYIERKRGNKKVTFPHPKLADSLRDTQGIMLYQEDVLNAAYILAGFTKAEGDDLRKAIGKKLMDKIGEYRKKFVEGCAETSNISPERANKIYSDIEFFAGYGFNRAHSAAYSVIAYVTAYLKTHYPVEYMAALLSSVMKKKKGDGVTNYLLECQKMDINVLAPSVNHSMPTFAVKDDSTISYGLLAIGGIGEAVVSALLKDREVHELEYDTIYEFLRSSSSSVLNKGVLVNLIESGGFDDLEIRNEEGFFERLRFSYEDKINILALERDKIGAYITYHPLQDVWHLVESQAEHKLSSLDQVPSESSVNIGGTIAQFQKKTTRKKQTMYILQVEDLEYNSIEVVIFPQIASKFEDEALEEGGIGFFSGRITHEVFGTDEDERRITKMYLDNFEPLDYDSITGEQPLIIGLDKPPTEEFLQALDEALQQDDGESNVFIEYTPKGTNTKLVFKMNEQGSTERHKHYLQLTERAGEKTNVMW